MKTHFVLDEIVDRLWLLVVLATFNCVLLLGAAHRVVAQRMLLRRVLRRGFSDSENGIAKVSQRGPYKVSRSGF